METKFNFNSAICTSKAQSERLLALGLKKETAEMVHSTIVGLDNLVDLISEHPWTARQEVTDDWYPAWSLHRLIEMMPDTIAIENATCMGHRFFYLLTFMRDFVTYEVNSSVFKEFAEHDNYYDNIIDCIEWLIKEGYFNKEYLV